MSRETFEANINELINVIEVCINNKICLPSLLLLYSGIDIMAWSNRPTNHDDVKKADFIKWVKAYILPNSNLICSAIDLYAARCGLLHSYTSESRLSRKGEAKVIFYAWGIANDKNLQRKIEDKRLPAIAIHINELFNAFRIGVKTYTEALSNDPEKATLVYERANKFFTNIPLSLQ